jgi:CrcB protein
MWKLISIASGGAIGAMMRYSVTYLTTKSTNSAYPWATFFVNLAGAFLIGFFWGIFEKTNVSSNIKSFVLIGLIGSFTTFSTLSFEAVKLFQQGHTKMGLFHIGITNLLGLALVIIGYLSAQQLSTILSKA